MPPAFWQWVEQTPQTIIVGTNRAPVLSVLQGRRLDVLVIRDTYRQLWLESHIGWKFHEEFWKPSVAYRVGPAHARYAHCDEFVRMVPGWQLVDVRDGNNERAVIQNDTVVLMAANFAWLCGCREIVLAGVDYTGGDCATMIRGYERSTGLEGRYEKPVPAPIERQFAEAFASVQGAGGRMVNVSPGSRLQAVPLVDWQAIERFSGEKHESRDPLHQRAVG
jgi:hypothetical protein